MHKPIKYVEKGLTIAARGAWTVFDTFNQIKPNPGFTPNWSDKASTETEPRVRTSSSNKDWRGLGVMDERS